MKNLFDEKDSQEFIARYRAIPAELAVRTYTSRLIGKDPGLVLHGGGNSSVKIRMQNILGEPREVLFVKGSGVDLATIEPGGFVGLELDWGELERLYAQAGLAPRVPTAAWRASVPVYVEGEQVGYATSGGWSPLLKKSIALAHLRSHWAAPGKWVEMEVTVEHRRKRAAARVVRKPFFDPERKRA